MTCFLRHIPALAALLAALSAGADTARIEHLVRISDSAPHNAFTDLVRWQDRFWCVFREGQGHVSPDGALRVMTSDDGLAWTSAARITSPLGDLRDPHVTVAPDGRLMLYAAAALPQPGPVRHQSLVWFSADGTDWGMSTSVGDPDVWLWRVAWHGGEALGVGYDTVAQRFTRLYRTRDGRDFRTVLPELFTDPQPNETGLVYLPDGTCWCLMRRDGNPGTGQLGRSRPPYTRWEWKDIGVRIGGPQLLRLPDGRILAGVRLYDGKVRTALCWVHTGEGRLEEFLTLPSGGDTSYPGLVWHGDRLWMSYYSSHEGRTQVYVARIRLP